MFSREEVETIFWCLFVLIMFCAGSMLGYCHGRDVLGREAIEQGYAEHDQATGDWQWKGEQCK